MGLKRRIEGRGADNLAAVVDPCSAAGGAAGERAEVDHGPVLEQESVRIPARGGGLADHLAAEVDSGSAAGGAAGESAEVDHHPVSNQKGVRLKQAAGLRIADHLAAIAGTPGDAEDAIGQSA